MTGSRASTEPSSTVSARTGFDPARIVELEELLLSLLHGEHSSLSISFNDSCGPNYETVQSFDETCGEHHADWISDEERDLAYALNREWVAQWYPQTPVGFCAIRASSLLALIEAIAIEARQRTDPEEGLDPKGESAGPQDIAQGPSQ